jgi:hypothetical protein
MVKRDKEAKFTVAIGRQRYWRSVLQNVVLGDRRGHGGPQFDSRPVEDLSILVGFLGSILRIRGQYLKIGNNLSFNVI